MNNTQILNSQLDTLWQNFGNKKILNKVSELPSDNLLTEKAILSLIEKASNGKITSLILGDDPDDSTRLRLMGKASNGELITLTYFPKEEHVTAFEVRKVTQVDVDNECGYKAGTTVLALTTNLDHVFMIDLDSFNFPTESQETNTIYSEIINGVLSSNVKVDDFNNEKSPIKIEDTERGIYANLKIDSTNTEVTLEADRKGLRASIPFEGGTTLKFRQLKLHEYLALIPVKDTVYFVTDEPFIYLNNVRYGINLLPTDYPIVSLAYNAEKGALSYRKVGSGPLEYITIPITDENTNGLFSIEQFKELKRLGTALDNLDGIKEYVNEELNKLTFELVKGEPSDGKVPISLVNKLGETVSTISIKEDNYLQFAKQQVANITDVKNAKAQGVTIKVGDIILLLTLADNSVLYINLSALTDIYTAENSTTVQTTVTDNRIKAELIFNTDNDYLKITDKGLDLEFRAERVDDDLIIYGKDNKEITTIPFSPYVISQEVVKKDGDSYLVLETGRKGEAAIFIWINLSEVLRNHPVSKQEGNLLTKDDKGYLYSALQWVDI